jgi:transcription regulator MmyB-like protein
VLGALDGRRVLNHPIVGRLVLDHTTFQAYDTPDLKLCIFTPVPESDTLERLRRLLPNHTDLAYRAIVPNMRTPGF